MQHAINLYANDANCTCRHYSELVTQRSHQMPKSSENEVMNLLHRNLKQILAYDECTIYWLP